MLRRFLVLLFVCANTLVASSASALTTYYVDPDWGGSQTGAAATPWTSLTASAWTAINATLASDDVTVYFSARNAGSDTNQLSTGQLTINRTDTSTHMLTLDGISQYNTNDAAPSWAPHITPSPTNYRAASKFQITSLLTDSSAIDAGGSAAACHHYITITGFRLISGNGQIGNLTYAGDLTIQYCELSRNPGGLGGPGLIVGPANGGPGCGGSGPNNVRILYNYIHDTWGECIYVGGSTPDPPGGGGAVHTGDNYLIQGNTISNCAAQGGQGDGTDIKDGHTNLRIINNVYTYPNLSANCDCQGIVMESGDLVDGNYIEAPAHNGIYVAGAWDTAVGRDQLVIRNNVIVNINGAVGHHNGIELTATAAATSPWSNVKVYNNSIYGTADACLYISGGGAGPQSNVTVENNIVQACGAHGLLNETPGSLATHDYNEYFDIITGAAVSNAGTTTGCASIATVEPHSLCADPQFMSLSSPYTAASFRLRAGSPAMGAGLDLSAAFTDDFAGSTRATPWDMGAFSAQTSAPPPAPPTGLVAVAR